MGRAIQRLKQRGNYVMWRRNSPGPSQPDSRPFGGPFRRIVGFLDGPKGFLAGPNNGGASGGRWSKDLRRGFVSLAHPPESGPAHNSRTFGRNPLPLNRLQPGIAKALLGLNWAVHNG
jgi:hypothetical protein